MPRQAMFYCSHANPNMARLSASLPDGFSYRLIDDDEWEHEFHLDETLQKLRAIVVNAVGTAPTPGDLQPQWTADWQLYRVDSDGREDGVWVCAVTDAASVPDAVTETVETKLETGLAKFTTRWAQLHVLVFENQWLFTKADRVRGVLAGQEDEIDLIDWHCWWMARTSSKSGLPFPDPMLPSIRQSPQQAGQ